MMRRTIRAIRLGRLLRAAAVVFMLILLGIEVLFAHDPLGLIYLPELRWTYGESVVTTSGWQMKPGHYRYWRWSATVNADGTRWTPAAADADAPRWLFVGDSLTFGYGVDDEQAFVSLIGRARPDGQVINAGVVGYASRNVRLRAQELLPTADRLFYLIHHNDAEPQQTKQEFDTQPPRFGWALYLGWWDYYQALARRVPTREQYLAGLDWAGFCEDLKWFDAVGAAMFVFDGSLVLEQAQRCARVQVIMSYAPHFISHLDDHPNAVGQAQIAGDILAALAGR